MTSGKISLRAPLILVSSIGQSKPTSEAKSKSKARATAVRERGNKNSFILTERMLQRCRTYIIFLLTLEHGLWKNYCTNTNLTFVTYNWLAKQVNTSNTCDKSGGKKSLQLSHTWKWYFEVCQIWSGNRLWTLGVFVRTQFQLEWRDPTYWARSISSCLDYRSQLRDHRW